MTTLNDIEDMIARMAMGDRAALARLYAATSAKLFGISLRILGDRAEAEDALQEVFVKVWHNAGRYRSNGLSPMTWLITVARNHSIDRLRSRPKATTGLDEAAELADLSPNPEEALLASGLTSRIHTCLDSLDPDRADAVRRAYLGGEAYAELSDRYAVPLNTIRTWLRRSLLKLRECLGS